MIYSIGDEVNFNKLNWLSDWDGHEVGHSKVLVVGLYQHPKYENIMYYVNAQTERVIEVLIDSEDDY